eukprot:6210909-Pleurochrysis_carterae.AAC.3
MSLPRKNLRVHGLQSSKSRSRQLRESAGCCSGRSRRPQPPRRRHGACGAHNEWDRQPRAQSCTVTFAQLSRCGKAPPPQCKTRYQSAKARPRGRSDGHACGTSCGHLCRHSIRGHALAPASRDVERREQLLRSDPVPEEADAARLQRRVREVEHAQRGVEREAGGQRRRARRAEPVAAQMEGVQVQVAAE